MFLLFKHNIEARAHKANDGDGKRSKQEIWISIQPRIMNEKITKTENFKSWIDKNHSTAWMDWCVVSCDDWSDLVSSIIIIEIEKFYCKKITKVLFPVVNLSHKIGSGSVREAGHLKKMDKKESCKIFPEIWSSIFLPILKIEEKLVTLLMDVPSILCSNHKHFILFHIKSITLFDILMPFYRPLSKLIIELHVKLVSFDGNPYVTSRPPQFMWFLTIYNGVYAQMCAFQIPIAFYL